jgi:dolichyl-phosphate-mannose--protein O-mannosyl transferase
VLALLVAGGVAARCYRFDEPARIIFDEHHFVVNARNYLAHRADQNDHPPLGKLVLAASMKVAGDNSWAWRFPALVLGLLTLLVAGLAAARLFHSRFAGLTAAALVASDGFFISYSRTALLDGQLVVLLALSLWLVTTRWRWRTAAAAGVLLGTACNVKFSGIGLVVLFTASLLLDSTLRWKQRFDRGAVLLAIAFTVYCALYAWGLSLAGQPTGLAEVLADTQRLLVHHAALTEMKNDFVSGWPTWFVPTRPLAFFRDEHLGEVRMVTMLGNLTTWWATSAVFLLALGWVLRDGVRAVCASVQGKATVLLLAAALGFLAPWVMTHRDSYLYHYLPSYLALVLLLSGALAWLRQRHPTSALAVLCGVLVVAALYGPLWCGLPMGSEAADARLFLKGWR